MSEKKRCLPWRANPPLSLPPGLIYPHPQGHSNNNYAHIHMCIPLEVQKKIDIYKFIFLYLKSAGLM